MRMGIPSGWLFGLRPIKKSLKAKDLTLQTVTGIK
ncbi:hypothetical protein [Klebsiella phage RothC]|uniref:Uncharacterized protein n=2 Tax=Viruses TaxID=10239 RepID=A0AB39C0J9_9CAUD